MITAESFEELSLENVQSEARSLETPGCHWDWDDALLALIGQNSSAGIPINQLRLLQYAPYWRATTLFSRDIAKLPFKPFRLIEGNRGKEEDPFHPAHKLLTSQANAEMSAYDFRMHMQTMVMVHGNAYALILRDMRGAPIELIPLDPLRVRPQRVPEFHGPLHYVVNDEQGRHRIYEHTQVLHIKGLSLDGMSGLPFYQMAAESVALGLAAQKYGSVFFRNGATPSVVLSHPNFLTDKARSRLRDGWQRFQGVENQHKTIVLEEGVEAKQLGLDPERAQMTELRAHEIRDMASWASCPAHKLGDVSQSSYNSLEEQNRSYLLEGLDGWLCAWEAECTSKLLTERSKRERTHCIEFNREVLTQADMATRFEAFAKAKQGGWMTDNEIRARLNLPAMPGGDVLRQPLNMGDPDAPTGNDDDAEEGDQERSEAHSGLCGSVSSRWGSGNGVPLW